MLAQIIKIQDHLLRGLLLTLVFPFYYAGYVLKCALPKSWGGHPVATRFFDLGFWMFPVGIYVAALKGKFV